MHHHEKLTKTLKWDWFNLFAFFQPFFLRFLLHPKGCTKTVLKRVIRGATRNKIRGVEDAELNLSAALGVNEICCWTLNNPSFSLYCRAVKLINVNCGWATKGNVLRVLLIGKGGCGKEQIISTILRKLSSDFIWFHQATLCSEEYNHWSNICDGFFKSF